MNPFLLAHLEAAQSTLDPQYQALHAATTALKRAVVLAGDETLDAIAMHKHQARLEEAAARLDDPTLAAAVAAFAQQTQHGLDALAFEFARDLKHVFEQRGQAVEGRPSWPRCTGPGRTRWPNGRSRRQVSASTSSRSTAR